MRVVVRTQLVNSGNVTLDIDSMEHYRVRVNQRLCSLSVCLSVRRSRKKRYTRPLVELGEFWRDDERFHLGGFQTLMVFGF